MLRVTCDLNSDWCQAQGSWLDRRRRILRLPFVQFTLLPSGVVLRSPSARGWPKGRWAVASRAVGDYLLDRFRQGGVDKVFARPGDGINAILATIGDTENPALRPVSPAREGKSSDQVRCQGQQVARVQMPWSCFRAVWSRSSSTRALFVESVRS